MSGVEGLAAASLAGNILQFVHSAKKLLATTQEMLDSGVKREHLELEVVAQDLRSRIEQMSIPDSVDVGSVGRSKDSFQRLAHQGTQLADELLAVLQKLKSDPDSNRCPSFVQALRTQWHEPRIDALRQRLNTIAQAVNSRLADKSELGLRARLNELLDINRRMDISRMKDIVGLQEFFIKALGDSQKQQEDKEQFDEEKLAMQMDKVALDGKHYSAEQKILH